MLVISTVEAAQEDSDVHQHQLIQSGVQMVIIQLMVMEIATFVLQEHTAHLMLLQRLLVLQAHMRHLQGQSHVLDDQQDILELALHLLHHYVVVVNTRTKWLHHVVIVQTVIHVQILTRHPHFVHLDTIR